MECIDETLQGNLELKMISCFPPSVSQLLPAYLINTQRNNSLSFPLPFKFFDQDIFAVKCYVLPCLYLFFIKYSSRYGSAIETTVKNKSKKSVCDFSQHELHLCCDHLHHVKKSIFIFCILLT